ncbi:hypothetical protein [Spongiimicrobium sp. 3-5]|uniref:hypothetical protein n=1 Tax=Spongiimicrobium sp. 3-5 TaxID=3332596 RepID=UPI00398188BE
MTYGLRKAHKLIWLLLIATAPLGILFATLGIKEPVLTDSNLKISSASGDRHLIFENEALTTFLDPTGDFNGIQIFVKQPLPSPAAIAYGVSLAKPKGQFLGVLDKKGVYNFKVDKSINEIKIYDEIKEETLFNIEILWD